MKKNQKIFYITTPLYYVNDKPHIGHAYTTIAADVLARWKRLTGDRVFFLTGTDEHGSKILEAAQAHNVSPIEYADTIVQHFKQAWTALNISNDDFIRTTEDRHKKVVQKVFTQLMKNGDIELREYSGLYCVACETFWLKSDAVDGKCPDCKRAVEPLRERNFFFKLSKYQDKLLDLYNARKDFENEKGFLSGTRAGVSGRYAQEILNFVAGGLKDISVSRQNLSWGIPVPEHPEQTVYVWFDALLNYISAIGYGSDAQEDAEKFEMHWPCDIHFVGKEIYRFHTVIWPAMLLSLGLPCPKTVYAHGWWTVEGEKMSKSRGNVVDPIAMAQEFGADSLRYFLLREIPFGADGDFSVAALKKRYNSELANDLGNLFSRVLTLIEKNTDGIVRQSPSQVPALLKKDETLITAELSECLDQVDFSGALNCLMNVVKATNAFIEKSAPWKLVKEDPQKCETVLAECAIVLAWCAAGFYPFMPTIAEQMWKQLGQETVLAKVAQKVLQDPLNAFTFGKKVQRTTILFPRKM